MGRFKVIHFEGAASGSPDSAAWHAWRAGGIGASDALAVAAEAGLVSRSDLPSWVKKASALLAEKRGETQAVFTTNWAIERGRAGEEPVRKAYEARTGNIVFPIFAESIKCPFLRCSLDGISLDGRVLVEIKCPGAKSHALAGEGIVPSYYLPQLAHQALVVWGTDPSAWSKDAFVHYVSGVPETKDIHVVVLKAQELAELADHLLIAETAFWRARLKEGDGLYGGVYATLARAYLEADQVTEAAKAVLEKAREELMAFLATTGQARIEGDGLIVSQELRSGSVDYAALVKSLGITDEAVEAFRKVGSSSLVIRKLKPTKVKAGVDSKKAA